MRERRALFCEGVRQDPNFRMCTVVRGTSTPYSVQFRLLPRKITVQMVVTFVWHCKEFLFSVVTMFIEGELQLNENMIQFFRLNSFSLHDATP